MEVVNVSGLKNNPSEALRKARKDVVVVMNRDQPDALLVHLEADQAWSLPGVRAARLAKIPLAAFMQHPARLNIPAISGTADEVKRDMVTLEAWLASSRAMQAH